MAIKKYTNGAWVPITYHKYGTETESITSLPAQIIGDGQPITSCQISGNMNQNGTPTPSAPIYPEECGERTGNLFDYRKSFAPDVIVYNDYFNYYLLSLQPNTTYTAYTNCESKRKPTYNTTTFIITPDEIPFSTANGGVYKNTPMTFTTQNSGLVKVGIRVLDDSDDPVPIYQENDFANGEQWLMLNLGSTALLYEPYGYKLTPTVNGTEYSIYLGQVESTRKVKKLVLTGEEGWTITSNGVLRIGLSGQLRPSTPLCTHYLGSNSTAWSNVPDKSVTVSISGYLAILDTTYTAVSDFKSYLAAQYAAGTPVTVWYVLAEPETGIVNEPLMKIGDYADMVSVTSIPTTGTPEQFDIQTTLKPSEVQLTYHGWHEHTDTKYTE